jgi:hypothetical protein
VQYWGVTSWLELSRVHGDPTLATEQVAFVAEVGQLLDAAGTPGLDREHSDAFSLTELFDGALLIVLPLVSSPHASIQLQVSPTMILGTWDDKHYIWDSTSVGQEPLWIDGIDPQARALALQWLGHEIRRPFVRRRYQWGPLTQTTWGHTDGAQYSWTDSSGFLPLRPRGTQHSEVPAGYLDPPPPA